MATHVHVGETLQQNLIRNQAIPQRALLIADLPPGAVYAAAAAMFGAKVNANLTPHTAATDFFQAMSGYAHLHATVRVAPTAAALKLLLDCEEAARNNGAAALLDPVSRTYAGLVAASVVFISPTGDVVFAGGSESYGQAEDVYAFSNWAHGGYRSLSSSSSLLSFFFSLFILHPSSSFFFFFLLPLILLLLLLSFHPSSSFFFFFLLPLILLLLLLSFFFFVLLFFFFLLLTYSFNL